MPASATLTKSAIQKLTNDELLKLYENMSKDIHRRIVNYDTCRDVGALIDGIRFAKRAHRIKSTLGVASFSRGGWELGLNRAAETLTTRLTEIEAE